MRSPGVTKQKTQTPRDVHVCWQSRRHGANLSRVSLCGSPNWAETRTRFGPPTPLDDLEFRINARMRLDLRRNEDYASIKDGRNRTAQQGSSAGPNWMITDSMLRNALLEETERSCTMWVATSSTMPVAKQGSKSQ